MVLELAHGDLMSKQKRRRRLVFRFLSLRWGKKEAKSRVPSCCLACVLYLYLAQPLEACAKAAAAAAGSRHAREREKRSKNKGKEESEEESKVCFIINSFFFLQGKKK